MTSALFWQNSISLCPALFCIPRPILPVTPGVSSYFCIPVPYNEKDIFWGCQFQKVLQVFIEPFNFSFFSVTGCGKDLDNCDTEWFALETNRDHSVIFEIVSKYCISDSSVDHHFYLFSMIMSICLLELSYYITFIHSQLTPLHSDFYSYYTRETAL